MTNPSTKLYKILTYLGTLPFLFAVFIGLSPYISIPEFMGGEIAYSGFKSKALMHSYAVVILSFLAGIQWGISFQQDKPSKLLVLSNVLALVAWISLMAFASQFALSILLVGYIVALLADYFSLKNQLISVWFWQLRRTVSAIVCLSLLFVILFT